ncbi:MAG: sulfatase-like hydrolase/transferase [Lentimicrobiaceae bacterium]|nr:sulfatase-like hydrolase/transferase [Lentimicrobiaceae bacterium]
MKKTTSFKEYINSQLRPLGVRLAFLILLYSIFRLLFFITYIDHFSNAGLSVFFHGIRFDLSAIFYTNVPYIVAVLLPFSFFYNKIYRKICNSYFIAINGVAAAVSYIDIAYYPYVLKRMTGDIFSYVQVGFDFQALLPSFLKQFWYLWLLFFATCFAIVYIVRLTNKMMAKNPVFHTFLWKDFLYKILVFLASVFISFVCMRGGFQTRPLGLIDTGKPASIQNAPVVSNTPFTLLVSFGKQQYDIPYYFQSLEEAEWYVSPIINTIKPCLQDCYPVKNVVVIILESFSQYLISGMEMDAEGGNYQGYAPFLDSLLRQSISFSGIANSHRTIDALSAIFGGLPKLLNKSYIESQYAHNYSYSPVEVLKNHGFNTLFFHGAKNNSMNIESYCYSIGFDTYYGKNEYPNSSDYDGVWGISDRSFLKYTARVLSTAQPPFFASVLTLSSHNPFVMPKDAEGLDIKTGTHPMHALASYTDYAVREFMEALSQNTWYDSTLFIFTGDHTSIGARPTPYSLFMTCQIPIFFYHPLANYHKKMGLIQQLDIMPTLLSYLSIDAPLFSYGNNIFDSTYTSYSANYTWGFYHLITEDFVLRFDGKNSVGFFNIKDDILMKNNLVNDLPDEVALYERKLKAIIQSHRTRMVRNQLFAR